MSFKGLHVLALVCGNCWTKHWFSLAQKLEINGLVHQKNVAFNPSFLDMSVSALKRVFVR